MAVLTYPVTPGRRYSPSVVNGSSIPTLNGTKITVDGTELNDGQATITATDFEASNGVVHAIDGVSPPQVCRESPETLRENRSSRSA